MDDGLLLSMRGIDKRFAGIPALTPGVARNPARRGPRADRPERRRQVDADQGADRLPPPRRRRGPVPGQAVRGRARRSRRRRAASARSTRRSTWCRCAASPRTSASAARSAAIGLLDWSAMHAEAERLLSRFSVKLDVRRPLAGVLDRHPADGRDRPCHRLLGPARDHGRTDLLARRAGSRRCCSTSSASSRRTGVSVIFVSHKLDELYEVCDRVTIMRDGRTVRSADMAEIGKLELVSQMLGRDISKAAGPCHRLQPSRRARPPARPSSRQPSIAARQAVRDVSFELRRGRDRELCRPARRRTDRNRARCLRRRPAARRRHVA